jgi:hypothetical protein
MKLANIMVAIGGTRDTTFPKYGVTAGEIAVLRQIHGEDSVFDVEPTDEDALNEDGLRRTNRQELNRLKMLYGRAKDGGGTPLVEQLYPGAAARVFEGFDELELPDEFFKSSGRVAVAAPVEPKVAKKAKPKAAEPVAAPAPEGDDDDDGIGDMPETEKLFG